MYHFLTFLIFVFVANAQKTVCPPKAEFGPSTGGLCALGAIEVINGMCCDMTKVQNVACEDQLDVKGNSLCPLTRIGCYRNLLGSLKEEIDFCAKTCGYCPMPSFW